jgi:hypothetical protein
LRIASNSSRGVVCLKPDSVEVQKIDFPTFRSPAGKTIHHGVILKALTTNIYGSDQRTVGGPTTAPAGIAVAVFGALSLLIVDHGLWNRPYVESARAYTATEAAAKADGALITPTRKPSLYSRMVRQLR